MNNIYNTQYECQYMSPAVFKEWELEILSKEEQMFVRNVLYKQDMLFIFHQEESESEFCDETIHEAISKLFAVIERHSIPELNTCMAKLAGRVLSSQLEMGFVMLYSYDYLHLVHPCISELLEFGHISENKHLLDNLVNEIG
jgi:hypothetical protein